MGREVRRVPQGWEHPRDERGHFRPLFDRDYETEAREWLDAAIAWDLGTHKDVIEEPARKLESPFYWEWAGAPPDPESYRPKWTDEQRTHFQVYETVSEGTPLTPAFATADELVEYLVEHGDQWDQRSQNGGWSRQEARAFVERGFAFTAVLMSGVGLLEARDQGAALDGVQKRE